jgi:phage terminase large subunit
MLVMRSLEKPTRILCAREIQKSILDSCLQLLSDSIYRLGVESEFDIQSTQILGKNGSRFMFEGLKSNISKIKSMEGIDIVWCEEADQVTATSWNTLIPTIRKPGSEIWVSFNPADEMDDTYQRFVADPPEGAYVAKVNYSENPWFPPELERERLAMKEKSESLYQHIWEGLPVANRDGAYYAKYINQEQVMNIPVEASIPVNTYWDLGVSDSTAIWFVQQVANEIRILHTYENQGEGLAHYVNYIHDWRDKNQAVMGSHYAPHDIAVRELGSGKSRLEMARSLGIAFQVAPNVPVDDGIQAARAILPKCWFNKPYTADGLRALRSYRKEFDEAKGVFKPRPLHDWSSHYADAFRYFALSHRDANNTWSAPVSTGEWGVF